MSAFRPLLDVLPRQVQPRVVQSRGPFVRLGPALVVQPEPEPEPEPEPLEALEARVVAQTEARVRAELAPKIAALEARIPKLEAALVAIEQARKETLHDAAADVAELVRMLANRVLGHTLRVDVAALRHVIEEAVAGLPDDKVTAIRVPLAQVDAVRDALDASWRERVRPDPAVTAGARIDTETAVIDATLDATLAGVDRALDEWLDAQNHSR